MRLLLSMLIFLCSSLTHAANSSYSLVENILPQLQQWGTDPVLVQAVQEQNSQKRSLKDIQAKDMTWINQKGVSEEMRALMENPAAIRLKEMEATFPFLFELFLTDNQGANVAMTNRTTDYWQGDEDKWIKSFKNGQGELYIGEPQYDKSMGANLIQVSIPITESGHTIGVLVIGISLDALRYYNKK